MFKSAMQGLLVCLGFGGVGIADILGGGGGIWALLASALAAGSLTIVVNSLKPRKKAKYMYFHREIK